MKKILFLLLLTVSMYGQTLQNPTFGNTTTNTLKIKTPATVTSVNYLSTVETDGTVSRVLPENITLNIVPPPVNYVPSEPNLQGHLKGLDTRLGQIGNTTAGITNRIYFTGVDTTISAGTFFTSSAAGKGAVAVGTPAQTVTNNDNEKKYFTKDIISIAQPSATTAPPGNYSGQLSVRIDANNANQKYTIEIYKCNNGGTPIASGITGAPIGSLGVTVVAILDSGLLNLVAGNVSNIALNGNLASTLSLNTGERLRYHVSAEKAGTDGGNIVMEVFYGSNYNSFYDVTVSQKTSTVLNDSGVVGLTASDALNNLNSLKAPLASPTFTGNVTVPTPTLGTDAVNKTYADGLIVGLLNDRGSYNASSNLFPTTGGSGTSGAILKGDIWFVSAAGTLGGKAVAIGDSFRALVNTPGQTASNWSLLSSNLSYIPANDSNVIHTTGNETKAGSLQVSQSIIEAQPMSSSPNYITQNVTSDWWKIYGSDGGADKGEMVLEVGDNGVPYASLGQRFRFYYNAANSGVAKSPFIIDYNDITADANISATGNLLTVRGKQIGTVLGSPSNTGNTVNKYGNLIGVSFTGMEISTSWDGAFNDEYLNFYTHDGGVSNGVRMFIDKSGLVNIANLAGTGTRQVVADASGNLSATDVAPVSGTYTPTLTNTLNVSSTSLVRANYIRVGNVVTVTFNITTSVTAASTGSQITMSLPVIRVDTTSYEAGSGAGYLTAGIQTRYSTGILTLSSNTTEARVYFIPLTSGGNTLSGTFTYNIN